MIIAVMYSTWADAKIKPEKNSGLNGIQTHSDLHDTGAFFPFYRYITNSQHDQLPVGLIAQLVEHYTGISQRS